MIYLDHNASTPIDPFVAQAMAPYVLQRHGNPSSGHAMGKTVRRGVDGARRQVAAMLNADTSEIIFTASGTEANNQVIKGVAHTFGHRGKHIVISSVEHPAVVQPSAYLERLGFSVTRVPVDATGRVDPTSVFDAITPNTLLVSIMLANNEVGTLQPVERIAKHVRQRGALMHTDAAQACGKIPVDVRVLGVDFLSLAGHKLYAPQGVGALYIRDGLEIEPLLHGAGHEDGRRAGTEAVQLIVGLGAACELATRGYLENHCRTLRDRLHHALSDALGERVVLLGHPQERLPNTLAIGFRDAIGADILASCPDICASTGAACHSTARKRSAVLEAMDVPEAVAFGAVRFSVGRSTTEQQIDQAADQLIRAIHI